MRCRTFPHAPRLEPDLRLLPYPAQHLQSISVRSRSVPSHFLSIHRYRDFPRVQLARSLSTFVPVFPKARGLRLGCSSPCRRLSRPQTPTPHPPPPRDLGIASGVSPFLLSTCLVMPREVSRVQHGRRKRNDGGGVFLSLPLPLSAAPQSLHRGEDRLPSVTMARPAWLASLSPYSHRSYMI